MTQDEIIDAYKEVSNKLCNGTEWCWAGVGEPLQLFAKLVAAKERVACFDAAYDAQATTAVLEAIRARSISRGEA